MLDKLRWIKVIRRVLSGTAGAMVGFTLGRTIGSANRSLWEEIALFFVVGVPSTVLGVGFVVVVFTWIEARYEVDSDDE